MDNRRAKRIGFRVLKVFGWIILSVVALLLLVIVAVQIPAVQNRIKQEAVGFLEVKIGTPVRLEHFSLSFPKKIILEGLYLEDQEQDTLLYAGRVSIDTDLWALTDNTIELNRVELSNIVSRIKRSEADSAFNFDYILKAFASPDSVPPDTTATVWTFRLDEIDLDALSFYLNDSLSGNHVQLALNKFIVDTETFDLDSGNIRFNEIFLGGLTTRVLQSKAPASLPDSVEIVPEDSAALAFNIGFNTIQLEDIHVGYQHLVLGQNIEVRFAEVVVEADTIDLKKQIIDLTRISLADPFLSFQQMEVEAFDNTSVGTPASNAPARSTPAQEPWRFSLASFELSGGKVQYYDHGQPQASGGMDFAHLVFSDLNARANDLYFDGEEAYAVIHGVSFREKSGFSIRSFRASMAVLADSLALSDLRLVTGNSDVRVEGYATYPSLTAMSEDPRTVNGALNIPSASLSLRDLLLLYPAVMDSLPLSLPADATVRLDARISGNAAQLNLDRFQLHTLEKTSLFANGSVKNVMEPENMFITMAIDRFYTTRQDIETLLVDSLIPPSIEVPGWIDITANYRGTTSTPAVAGTFRTDFGTIQLDAVVDLNEQAKENYRGEVRILDFYVGKLLKQPEQMGRLDMVATVDGAGLSVDELDGRFKMRMNKFFYNGYTYRDFRLDGSMKKYFFSGEASMADENLDFLLTGDLDYRDEAPHYKLALDLKNIDLKKLNFTSGVMRAKGRLEVDLTTPDFQKLNGDVGIRDFAIFNGDALYAVDSLLFASIDQEGRSEISLRSDILSGDFVGTINIFSLPDLLARHFNQYFSMQDTAYAEPVEDQRFRFELVLMNTDLITEVLVPDLEPFVPGTISGEFDSASDELRLDFLISEVNYSGIAFDTISLRAISDPESFDFTIALQNILVDTLNIKALRLAGNVMHDSIRTNLAILDSLKKEKYYLGGVFHSVDETFRFSFLQDQVKLNYEDWQTPLYNSLVFTSHGLEPNNFYIARDNQRILLYERTTADSTLSIAFREVELRNVTSLVEGTTPVSGLIDGELTLASAAESAFETNLKIIGLAILEKTWGDLRLAVKKEGQGPMNYDLVLEGDDAQLGAKGFLSEGPDAEILLEAELTRLNLSIVEPLTMGQLKEMKGTLTGDFTMQGPTADPQLSGRVNFKETSFYSTFANTSFSLPEESIFLRSDDIVFDKFDLFDARKNKATLDGLVSFREKGGFNLRLNLTARDFQLLNTNEDDNDLFYGNVRVNTTTTITGTSLTPVVNMNVSLSDESHLTYVVPQSERGVLEQEGIVLFYDKDAVDDPFMRSINPQDTVEVGFTGIDLTANIQLNGTERFNVVLDPITGDRLSVQGKSTLTLKMSPAGDMELTGRYEIVNGTYDLSFAKFVKRNFQIEKGSNMVWSGDVLNAKMDIRALYQVETAPADLVASQSQEVSPMYRQQLPFYVYLILKGELLSPEISFELSMPERNRDEYGDVYARLQDINTRESELNKQVFALLVLKRFISENPFESQAGGGLEGSARKSVSKILSDQLNRLSSNVRGVELSFDLKSYEDYSTGAASNTTDLELGLSKGFLNDRLVVKVSGNVNLEGENTQQDSFTDFIGDLALEYKLTEDGRIRVTGFRNNTYDMINGDIIETGAGVIYIKDFDTLNELFKANDKGNKVNNNGTKE